VTASSRRRALEQLYAALEGYERLYQFRDPNNACLFNLRVNECYVLELVVERGPMAVVEIAQAIGIHKSNASRIAQSLREKGLVVASADSRDRRSMRVQASAKGQKHYRSLRAYLVDRFETTLRKFSADEIKTVASAVSVLAADAEERMKAQRTKE
jgi:DNA-binding MarR family transcriptional regulator